MNMNLLIVEDDKDQLLLYNDIIDSFSKKNEFDIKSTCFDTIEDGMNAIRQPNFDAAIIDLKLSSDSTKLEGMDLVNAINKKLRIPIYIVSGSISQIEIQENYLLKKRLRTDDFKTIIAEIKEIYDTGITSLLKQDGFVDQMLTKIFWEHLSDSLNDLKGIDTHKILIRYISSHIQEFLEMDSEGDLEDLHPAEFYIYPPIKKYLSTGDIIKNKQNGSFFLLLTPACDILLRKVESDPLKKTRNAEKALLIDLILWNSIEGFNTLMETTGKNNTKREKLNILTTNKKERYHFLPPYKIIKGYFADFQSQTSYNFNEIDNLEKFERIATITQPFLKDIIARFSQYYSRQGQPDLLQEKIYKLLVIQNHP
jgi:ActR/RegA family two-component response regulator